MTQENFEKAKSYFDSISVIKQHLENVSTMERERKVVVPGLKINYNGNSKEPYPLEVKDKDLIDYFFKKVTEQLEVDLAFYEAAVSLL